MVMRRNKYSHYEVFLYIVIVSPNYNRQKIVKLAYPNKYGMCMVEKEPTNYYGSKGRI